MEYLPDLSPLATVVVVLLLALCATAVFGKSRNGKRFPPLAGTFVHQLLKVRTLHNYHTELSRKYRTFRLFYPFRNQIYTVDPANIEYILKTNFKNYGKGYYAYEMNNELFGDGIFSVDGYKWRHQRKFVSYEFSTKAVRNFSGVIFKSKAVQLAHVVLSGVSSNIIIDIQDLFMRSTMDAIFKVGFGVDLNSLEGSKDDDQFRKAFDNSSIYISLRYINAFWKIARFLNIGGEAELKRNIKVIDDFIYMVINTKIEQASSQINDPEEKEDMLSRFLVEKEKDPEKMTRKYLRDIVLNFLVAGKDTTAGTLSWFIFLLCKHPTVQEKIAHEVKESIGADEDINIKEFSECINDEALDKMHYLHATLSETLRLYPVVPFDAKICFSDDTLPDGYNVEKDDVVTYQPYAMGRMKFLWGEDAEIFQPERWINSDGLFCPESPFKFTAFQAGPRICLGKEFAYRQMKIFASVLLRFFKFELADETIVVNYKTMITLHIDEGLHVHVFHR